MTGIISIKKLLKTFAFLLLIALAGCSKESDINSLTDSYKSSGNEQDGYKAVKLVENMLHRNTLLNREWLYDDEIQSLIELADLALSKEHYKLFVDVYELIDYPVNDSIMELISNSYKGKDGDVNDLIAKWNIKQGRLKSAFRRLEIAALDDSSKADAVRYILMKYGCMDTALIWAELSSGNYTFMSSYDDGSDKYPAIPTSLEHEDIVSLRVKLREGSVPPLQPDCPIHKYQ